MASPAPSQMQDAEQASGSAPRRFAMDCHVHLQDDFPIARVAANFAKEASGHTPLCMVVESYGVDHFSDLTTTLKDWGDLGLRDPETDMHFIAGRQIVSAEGLEILLIGFRDQSLEGKPAHKVIEAGLLDGALTCLPWGFGKWLGARRQLVSSLSMEFGDKVRLADIANRPGLWQEPLFQSAGTILRGADNLPMARTVDWVGRFGNLFTPRSDPPSADAFLAALKAHPDDLRAFGKRKSLFPSFAEQVRYRLRGKAV